MLATKNAFNHDAGLLGEYPPPFPPIPFQGIGNLLPPRQYAPENISGEFRVQHSFEQLSFSSFKYIYNLYFQ